MSYHEYSEISPYRRSSAVFSSLFEIKFQNLSIPAWFFGFARFFCAVFADPVIRKAYCSAEWNGPSAGQLDPGKEVQAAELRVQGP